MKNISYLIHHWSLLQTATENKCTSHATLHANVPNNRANVVGNRQHISTICTHSVTQTVTTVTQRCLINQLPHNSQAVLLLRPEAHDLNKGLSWTYVLTGFHLATVKTIKASSRANTSLLTNKEQETCSDVKASLNLTFVFLFYYHQDWDLFNPMKL